jgi:PAS domain S-box-containing protein
MLNMSHREIQLRETVAALKKSQARLRELANALPVGMLVQLASLEVVLCNPRVLELLDLTQEQLEGKVAPDPGRRVIHPDGSPFDEALQPVPLAIASRNPVQNVVMGIHRPASGEPVWLLIDAIPQLAPDGSVQQVLCTLTDISSTFRSREILDRAAMEQRTTELFREREAFTESILNSVSSEVVVLSRNGTIVAVNEAWRRFASENRSESGDLPRRTEAGANYLDVCAESLDPSAVGTMTPQEGIRAVIEGRLRCYTHEYPCDSPDTKRWFLMQVTPFEGPKIVGAVVNHTDITRRKLAEISLQASTVELKQAQQIAHIGSWHWDRETDVVTASEELCRIFGRRSLPPFSEQNGLLYPEQAWQTLKAEVQRTLKTGIGYRLDLPARRSDARPIWINVRGNPVLNARREIVGLRGTVQDITEHRQTQQQLAAAREQLQQIIDISDEGFWDWDTASGLVIRSPRYLALLDGAPQEASRDFEFFKRMVHPDDLPRALQCIQDHTDGRSPSIAFEFRLADSTGAVKWLRVKGRVVSRDAEGMPLRVAGTLSDITEHKLAHMALQSDPASPFTPPETTAARR